MFNFSYYRNFIEKSKYLKTDFRRNPVSQDWFSGICFFNSKESKFKVNVLKLNKTDKIRNFDIYEI